jgi:hypothetical protein
VLATHALAFIDIPGQPAVYELHRVAGDPVQPNRATIQPLDPASLTPYTQLARAIGFDRGELLARWKAFLITDARTATILEELCGEQLGRSRIKLIALKPQSRPPELTEISLLAQLTTAPIAILTASVTRNEIARLQVVDADQRARTARQPGEAATVAKRAIELSIGQERDVDLLTLEIGDITELLDPQSIRDAQPPDKPPFPGHHESWRLLHRDHCRRDGGRVRKLSASHLRAPDRPRDTPRRRGRDARRQQAHPAPADRPALAARTNRPRSRTRQASRTLNPRLRTTRPGSQGCAASDGRVTLTERSEVPSESRRQPAISNARDRPPRPGTLHPLP